MVRSARNGRLFRAEQQLVASVNQYAVDVDNRFALKSSEEKVESLRRQSSMAYVGVALYSAIGFFITPGAGFGMLYYGSKRAKETQGAIDAEIVEIEDASRHT